MADEQLRDAMTSVEFAADEATPYHAASLVTSVPLARVIMDLKARVEELERWKADAARTTTAQAQDGG